MAETQEALHFLDYLRVVRSRKEVVISAFLLVVIAGVLVTYAMPRVYRASAVIRVKEEAPDVSLWSPEMMRYDPLRLRTQFEIIQSAPVLEEVIRRTDLNQKLGAAYGYLAQLGDQSFDQTLKIVSKSLKVQQYRDTKLIEIQMYMSEPEDTVLRDVSDVANMVAVVYRDLTISRARAVKERALKALEESVAEQRERVLKLEDRVEEVREKYEITVASSAMGSDSSYGRVSLTALEQLSITARLELEDKGARYEQVRTLSKEDLLDAVPYVIAANSDISVLLQARRKADVELRRLVQASFGPKHPEILRAKATIDELNSTINDALNGLRTGVKADYAAAKAKYEAVLAMLEERKTEERAAEAGSYREFDKALDELNHARSIRDALELRFYQEQHELRIPRTSVDIIEPARPPRADEPVSPNILLNVVLSILVGLGTGIGLAYFVEYLDTSVKTIDDVEQHMQLPVLGVIPQKVKPFIDETAETAYAEAYRVLRSNILFSKKRGEGNVICVTSGSVGEGKSLTLFNLAYVSAQLGDRCIIVDGDLHRPRQHKMMDISNRVGLANILAGDVSIEDCVVSSGASNLDFLPSGRISGGVHGLIDAPRLRQVIDVLSASYDYIFFDAPPIIGVADTSMLVREMTGVVLVVQHRKYPRSVSARAKSMLDNLGVNILGVVLNNINISRDYSSYYYHQHYYYYPKSKRGDGEAEPKMRRIRT